MIRNAVLEQLLPCLWHGCVDRAIAVLQTIEPAKIKSQDRQGGGAGLRLPGQRTGASYENTYCPGCGELLVRRWGLSVTQYRLEDKKCPRCGRAIPVVTGS